MPIYRGPRQRFLGATSPIPQGQGVSGPMPSNNQPAVQYVEDFFEYGINIAALAAGGTFLGNIQIDADSDFRWSKFTHQANETGSADDLTGGTETAILITDSSAGRQLANTPVALSAMCGSGQLPFILPVPRIFKARGNIGIQVVNFSVGTTYDIRLCFSGNKIFGLGANN